MTETTPKPTADTLAAAAREIMEEILPQLDAYYDKQRAALNTDPDDATTDSEEIPPPVPPEKNTDPLKKLLSMRARCSKIKKLLTTITEPTRKAQLEAELAEKQKQIDAYEHR